MIQPGEIARLAYRLGLGDKTIEKDYVLTWLLLAIANSPLRDRLVFKGGTALKKVYLPDYRFSEDLDFTMLDDMPHQELAAEIKLLFSWLRREVNLTLAVRRVETHQTGNPTFYLNYVGPLRGDLNSRFIKTDFTRSELLLFPCVETPLHIAYTDCQGRAETLLVYSLEEIMAEKLCALLGRTEPRDLYDIHYLFTERLVDAESVSFRLGEKMAYKGLAPTALSDVLVRKQATLKRLWQLRLDGQMPDLPHFAAVVRETQQWLRQNGLA